VLGVVKDLPEKLRRQGFRRRDLKIRGVSDRRVKEVLKSLAETGYLDCDEHKGPQGYSYTLARDAEKISLGISLRPSPDNEETPANAGNCTGRNALGRYRPVPGTKGEEDLSRLSSATGRNGQRPVETDYLQEKFTIGRPGGEKDKCIHGYLSGIGCYLCGPNYPYRKKGEGTRGDREKS
jgi:hypothetical protein